MSDHTLQNLWRDAVQGHASHLLIVSDKDQSRFSYADADRVVCRLSARLMESGLKKGDVVCVFAPFHAEAVFVFWASARLGLVFVPVDFRSSPLFLGKIADQVRPKLIFSDRERYLQIKDTASAPVIVFDDGNFEPISAQALCFSEWLGQSREESVDLPAVAAQDAATILYTSGTTSAPKGVILSHGALYRSGRLLGETFGWRTDDVLLCVGELHAMSGLRNPCLATLHAGCSFVEADLLVRTGIFSIVASLKRHDCTLLSTAPALIRQFVEQKSRIEKNSLRTLRQVICTGSDLRAETISAFQDHYGIPVLNYYGLTETCGLCIGTPAGAEDTASGSVGVALGCRAEVVDSESNVLEVDQTGELRIASDNLMTGYFGDEEATRAMIREGCLYTGDLARIRADGRVFLVGRKSEIIKNRYGDLIHPGEIEAVLEEHPLVKEAGACGYVSSRNEENMAAFVVPNEDALEPEALFKQLREHVKQRLGPHRVPHVFHVIARIPRNSYGKILRRALCERL